MQKISYLKRVPAADQAVRILFCLADCSPRRLKLTDICEHVGINKSKGYSLLNTLIHHGLVNRDPESKTYSLGLELLLLSRKLLDNLGYQELTSPHLENLSKDTQATVLFCILRGKQIYVAAKKEAAEPIGVNIRIGHVFPDTHGAHGLAMAAFLPPNELEVLLHNSELYFLGDPATTTAKKDQVQAELEQCRRQGYAKDPGRLQHGINAVSAPVFGFRGEVFGCIVVVGTFPTELLDGYGSLAAAAAKRVSKNLGAPQDRIKPD
jgi:DNA-binding IclR family transcriptional regulator